MDEHKRNRRYFFLKCGNGRAMDEGLSGVSHAKLILKRILAFTLPFSRTTNIQSIESGHNQHGTRQDSAIINPDGHPTAPNENSALHQTWPSHLKCSSREQP